MSQGSLFLAPGPRIKKHPPALTDGDKKRIGRTLAAVRDVMSERWPGGYFGAWSLSALHGALLLRGIHASEAGISARIRELPERCGLDYEKWREPNADGLWLYRLTGEVIEPDPKPALSTCPHCKGVGKVGP